MSEQELKPCCCGNDDVIISFQEDPEVFIPQCCDPKCDWSLGWFDTEQEAIEAWNYRPIEDELRSEIEKLQREIEALKSIDQALIDKLLKENEELRNCLGQDPCDLCSQIGIECNNCDGDYSKWRQNESK